MYITELLDNQIFVFGSNRAGRHGKGAALLAREKFNAEYGVGIGPTGRCYAIPTKDEYLRVLPLNIIKLYLKNFNEYAKSKPYLEFLLTPIGTGLAGYSVSDLESILPSDLSSNIVKTWT